MRVVTLVPWRGGDELREYNWEITRPYLEQLGYPLFTGDSEGPWARAAAINAAARAAGNWDIALIADADTIPDAPAILQAVRKATLTGGGVRPHEHLVRLTPSGVLAFIQGKPVDQPRHSTEEYPGGGLLVVAREGWDRVGGFDERFVGWGAEDSYFNTMLLVKADWDRIPGRVLHLYHLSSWEKTPQLRENRRLLLLLRRENRVAIQEAAKRKGYPIGDYL